jgi:tRNA A37 methylthiotransferase MiaB
MGHAMKEQVKERIVENNGKIIDENDKLIKAEFSYKEMEKAVKVLFELTKQMNQNAVLRGGCQLSVYYH